MLHKINFRTAAWLLVIAVMFSIEVGARTPKYVFLFIGDGLSFPQRMAAEEYRQVVEKRGLLINSFPHQASTTTRAADRFITDSAASGTAIACGEKTVVGRIGMSADGKRNLESVAEAAKKNRRKVAIITSVTLNHATPSSFYGHRLSRGMYYELGLDLISAGFDYYGGGGISRHTGANKKLPSIYDLAVKAGFQLARTPAEVRSLKLGKGKILAVGAPGALPYVLDKGKNDLRLADFVRQGIAHCDNPNGFFMMCEGGAIDWLCHANDAAGTLHEIFEFDDAVRVAYEFYKKHPEDTLIVVTGDHETGGLTLGFAGTKYKSYFDVLKGQRGTIFKIHGDLPERCTWDDAKKYVVKVSGLEFSNGKYDKKNTRMISPLEEKELKKNFHAQFPKGKKSGNGKFAAAIVRLINNKSGLAWTTGAHTALPVNTTAIGKKAELFTGTMDNTDISKRLKTVVTPVTAPR